MRPGGERPPGTQLAADAAAAAEQAQGKAYLDTIREEEQQALLKAEVPVASMTEAEKEVLLCS